MHSSALGFCLIALLAQPAVAQSDLCPSAKIAIIRLSKIKSGGSRAGFDQAVKDQIAWYRSHGFTGNRIVEADVLDVAARARPSVSSTEALTIHYDPPTASGQQIDPDDAYRAFVKEFRDNSDIEVEKIVCLPQ